ncbi:MAG TPA: NAD+ synthase [Spirochaetota bacterium]|nr:NAD+ synthase [Spirochaetota bacterium]
MFERDASRLMEKRVHIVSFIRDYIGGSGHDKGVVGLSGGIDSALSYFLTCEALGPANTVGVIMQSKLSSEESVKNAEKIVAINNGMKRYYDISPVVDGFRKLLGAGSLGAGSLGEGSLGEGSLGEGSRLRLGNIQARTRMIILYNVASEIGGLVIGTGNKSEILTGYFTQYGDGGCSIEPLGDLYKTEVWELAKMVGIPEEIIDKPPSAELWKDQTDESELGVPYKTLDEVLFLLIEKNHLPEEIEALGYNRKIVDRTVELVKRSRYKRHTPPYPQLQTYNMQELL